MNKDKLARLYESFDCFKMHSQPIVVKLKRRKSQCTPDVPDDPGASVDGLQREGTALGSSVARD